MDEQSCGEFLDLLYEAPAAPDLWKPVMEGFADLVGGTSAFLSRLNIVDGTGSVVTARLDPTMVKLYFDHYASRNPLHIVSDPDQYLNGWAPRILTDEDWMPKSALMRTEYYNDFMRPHDVHSAMMVRLALDDADVCVLNVARPERRGPFTDRERDLAGRLHPHLIRAFNLGQRLSETALLGQDIAVALDARCPTFLLDERGRVRHANRAAEDLMAQDIGLRIISGRLSSARSDVARRLEGLIGSAGSPDGSRRAGGAITLTAPGRRSPLCVAAAPLRSEHLSVFAGRLAVIVWVTDQDPGPSLPQARLRERFGLTSAEGRLALALLDGASPREAAGELGLSYHTVRNQLQGVFEKTGVHRQTELIMLLMRAISPEFA